MSFHFHFHDNRTVVRDTDCPAPATPRTDSAAHELGESWECTGTLYNSVRERRTECSRLHYITRTLKCCAPVQLNKWGDYPSMGEPVWPSRFIPMKTPLTEQLLSAWDPNKACRSPLTLPLVIASCKAKNRRLGMIMNLAGHDCLYEDDIPADVAIHHVRLRSSSLTINHRGGLYIHR